MNVSELGLVTQGGKVVWGMYEFILCGIATILTLLFSYKYILTGFTFSFQENTLKLRTIQKMMAVLMLFYWYKDKENRL